MTATVLNMKEKLFAPVSQAEMQDIQAGLECGRLAIETLTQLSETHGYVEMAGLIAGTHRIVRI